MSDDNLTTLTDEERDRLRRARSGIEPPRGLEERTVAVLRERGLIRPSRRPLPGVLALAAAAVVIVAGAAWFITHRSAAVAPAASMAAGPRYMLLLYAGAEPVTGTPDDRRREYAEWARDIASRGVAISGEELAGEMRVIGAGTAGSTAEPPRGFFIVGAADLAAAERLASTCPHLRHGGRIVIARIAG
jgi:hypothetical protein